jgi:hypothetical protein
MALHATPTRAAAVLDAAEPVPLAVWACAQTTGHIQRAGRYLPESTAHPGKMLPELARRITAEYAPSGGLVCDPMCGIGTTLVEVATLGRRAVGVELEARWADLARKNLALALPADRVGLGEVRTGDARGLPELLADLTGRVDLVATSPPYACTPGMIDKPTWRHGGLWRAATPRTTPPTAPTSATPAAPRTWPRWPGCTRAASRSCGPVGCWSPSPATCAAEAACSTSPARPCGWPSRPATSTCSTSSRCWPPCVTAACARRGRKYREPLVVPDPVLIWPGSMPADQRSGVVVRRPIVKPASPERREQAIKALAQLLVAWLERRASGTTEALPGGGRVLDGGPDPGRRP